MQDKPRQRALCRNSIGADYQPRDAIKDLEDAIQRGSRPLDPRNWETRFTRSLRRW